MQLWGHCTYIVPVDIGLIAWTLPTGLILTLMLRVMDEYMTNMLEGNILSSSQRFIASDSSSPVIYFSLPGPDKSALHHFTVLPAPWSLQYTLAPKAKTLVLAVQNQISIGCFLTPSFREL